MRFGHVIANISAILPTLTNTTFNFPWLNQPLIKQDGSHPTITPQLFAELEELARIVDISYCVGVTGIQKPFQCLGRCAEFPQFELVTAWNTGPLLSDSCGYIAFDHSPTKPRIILAFRGTYSLINTISDLSTIPQEYVPYLGNSNDTSIVRAASNKSTECTNCTVHSGFLHSWYNTRNAILPVTSLALDAHPNYELTLVGHSLGGAVALLASLEFVARGWTPSVTTFGEPRVGNKAFVKHVDSHFKSRGDEKEAKGGTYRRVTHVDDPVPLLPLTEWGYHPHADELYISKHQLPPDVPDIWQCKGDEDAQCSAGNDPTLSDVTAVLAHSDRQAALVERLSAAFAVEDELYHAGSGSDAEISSIISKRYKLWQLFFSHRDYFCRLGVCIPGGDPWGWKGTYGDPEVEAKEEL